MQYVAIPLSDDPDTQVAQTIDMMRRHVIEDSESEPIRRVAAGLQAAAGGLSGEPADPIAESFYWVKNRIRFQQDADTAAPLRHLIRDPQGNEVVEVLIRPRDLVDMPDAREDCDGFASTLPALLRAQGIPCNFVTVAADNQEPGVYSHVYSACYPNGQRIALDSSHGPYPGWEATQTGQVTRVREWPIDGWSLFEWFLFGCVIGAVGYLAMKVL